MYWLKDARVVDGRTFAAGTIWVPASGDARRILEEGARDLGVPVQAVGEAPKGDAWKLRPVRIGLYDQYGGLMTTGWDRWLFEQYGFGYERVYPQDLDRGDLKSRFDVLVFPDGAFTDVERRYDAGDQPAAADIPAEYRGWLGHLTRERTIPQVKAFLEAGGTVVAVGTSTTMGHVLGVPVRDHLTRIADDGTREPLPEDEFYIPGSLLRVHTDPTNPLAYGLPAEVDVVYDNNPVFDLEPAASLQGVAPVAWFAGAEVLRSGWAWGQAHLDGGTAVVSARVGAGHVALLGPAVTFRGQPHATFKLLFNGVLYGAAEPVTF